MKAVYNTKEDKLLIEMQAYLDRMKECGKPAPEKITIDYPQLDTWLSALRRTALHMVLSPRGINPGAGTFRGVDVVGPRGVHYFEKPK